MALNTVIFDMDGLLIDSEPSWEEAGREVLQRFDVTLTAEQYQYSTGLRTREWIEYWFRYFQIDPCNAKEAGDHIVRLAIEKIRDKGKPMPGADLVFPYFRKRNFKIGLATSSPPALIDVVVEKLQIGRWLDAVSSADELEFSKPHPEVYIHCARLLKSSPLDCICFEDSYNGMIAVKAARMTCVVVPTPALVDSSRWGAADIKIASLLEVGDHLFD